MLIPLGILASSGGGAAGSYELISTTILGSAQASVTFDTSALSAYKHLQIRSTSNTTSTVYGNANLLARFNSDSGSNYAFHLLYADGSGVGSAAATSQASMGIGDMPNSTSIFGAAVTDILDFSSSTKNTTVRSFMGVLAPGAIVRTALRSGVWVNTAVVTSITLFSSQDNLKTGSRFSLYGIKG